MWAEVDWVDVCKNFLLSKNLSSKTTEPPFHISFHTSLHTTLKHLPRAYNRASRVPVHKTVSRLRKVKALCGVCMRFSDVLFKEFRFVSSASGKILILISMIVISMIVIFTALLRGRKALKHEEKVTCS